MASTPFNLKKWIEDHRDQLKPPVCNQQVWEDAEFIVMIVGGPNQRKDFHVNCGEEFFYQLEGTMVLRLMEEGKPVDVEIREGDVYLLPPHIPHSPQRFANTVGMVVERRRRPGELDQMRWYCEGCGEILHNAKFQLVNIAAQLKPVIEEFANSKELRTCKNCGEVMDLKAPAKPWKYKLEEAAK